MEDRENTFKDVVGIILNNWSGLKLSIEHGMAGGFGTVIGKKLDAFIDCIVNEAYSRNSELELEDLLDDTMDNLFDTVLEDDSSRELALLVKNLAIKWQNGDVNAAYEYISSLPCKNNILTIYPGHQSSVFQKPIKVNCTDMNSTAANPCENHIAEDNNNEDDINDGWQVVKYK